MKNFKYVLILFPLMFLGCTEGWRDKGQNNRGFRLEAVTNAPVHFNERLVVKPSEYFSDYIYTMTYTKSKPYSLNHVDIENARYSDEGWYVITAQRDDFMRMDSVYVDVIPSIIPCTPDLNLVESTNGVTRMVVKAIEKINNYGRYIIKAEAPNGLVKLIFTLNEAPDTAATFITSSSPYSSDEVEIEIQVYNPSSRYYESESEQLVHLSYENGKRVITFCNLKTKSYLGLTFNGRFVIE